MLLYNFACICFLLFLTVTLGFLMSNYELQLIDDLLEILNLLRWVDLLLTHYLQIKIIYCFSWISSNSSSSKNIKYLTIFYSAHLIVFISIIHILDSPTFSIGDSTQMADNASTTPAYNAYAHTSSIPNNNIENF